MFQLPDKDITVDTIVKLEFLVPAASAEPFTAFLFDRVQYGWEEEERTGNTLFRVHAEDPAFARDLGQQAKARFPDVSLTQEDAPNRDWALAWREFFTAVLCGEDFVVIAPWMVEENPYASRIPIIIEPKTAFGTGHHPTTALCLEVLSELQRNGRAAPGMRFLDLGCGSGVLGLACAKLGLTGLGLDVDPLAVENSLENIGVNGVDPAAFAVMEGSLEVIEESPEQFDLVLANILAEPLIDLAPRIAQRVKDGGALVLSGVLAVQADAVAAAYASLGRPEPQRRDSGEWSALVW